jgi:hypothetical protein
MKTRWVLTSSLLGELQELWPAVFTGLFLEWIVYVVHRNELPSARGLCFGTSYQVREGSVFCVFFALCILMSCAPRMYNVYKRKIIEVLDSKIVFG